MGSVSPWNYGGLLPPPSAEEMQHLAELFKPDEEYYKIYSKTVPANPPKGTLLITRQPMAHHIRIIYASGESIDMPYDKYIIGKLVVLGIDRKVAERTLDYVWNFGKSYVKTRYEDLFAPPMKAATV